MEVIAVVDTNKKSLFRSMRSNMIVGVLVGIVLIFIGSLMNTDYSELMDNCTAEARGTLYENERKQISGSFENSGRYEYRAVFYFPAENGEIGYAYTDWQSVPYDLHSVTIMYDPENISSNYIKELKPQQGYFMYILSGVCFLFSIANFISIKKKGGTVIPSDDEKSLGDALKENVRY